MDSQHASPIMITCAKCNRRFSSHRGYSIHLSRSEECSDHFYTDLADDKSNHTKNVALHPDHLKNNASNINIQNVHSNRKRRRIDFDPPVFLPSSSSEESSVDIFPKHNEKSDFGNDIEASGSANSNTENAHDVANNSLVPAQ